MLKRSPRLLCLGKASPLALVMASALSLPNIRLFIAFRILFNARFYYPVFTVLFLDMGLTLEQFFLLNAVWAVSIVTLEVPSGAFADTFGRRNLVVLASICMILELALIAFVPLGPWVFWALMGNRIISGAAEAFASGADEALAFDTLKKEGSEADWPKVLDILMRAQSAAFFVAMLSGAAVYDAELLNVAAALFGFENQPFAAETTLRFPIYLTLATACLLLFVSLKMREVTIDEGDQSVKSPGEAFRLVGKTGMWILKSPIVLVLIAAALTFDSTARVIITLSSEYYRLIGLPEALLGVMGASMGLIGMIIPVYARKLVERKSAIFNFSLVALILGFALIGMAFQWRYWGVIPALGIGATLMLLGFFVSHYLNQSVTDSKRRATVLSFRSLATNLAYGAVGLLYMGFTAALRDTPADEKADIGQTPNVFGSILEWTPLYYVATLLALAVFVKWVTRKKG